MSVANVELKRSRTSLFLWLSRRAVLAHIARVHTGTLVIVEGTERMVFGQPLAGNPGLVAEIVIHNPICYCEIMAGGSIGAAEAYMSGDWSSHDLTSVVRLMSLNMDVLDAMERGVAALAKPFLKGLHWINRNSERGSRRNIAAHYDLGNDLFALFLDSTMMYSSGIFPSADASMAEASRHKLDVICKTLQLSADDHVIEIGTGWGGFAVHAAQYYGCRVTTTTISQQQYAYAKARIARAGLADRITLVQEDYRQLRGQYDKLVSIEMIEAVGWQYYGTFFRQCESLLKPDGVMMIQAITINEQRYERAKRDVDFIKRYVFPGGCLPSVQSLLTAMGQSGDLRLIAQHDYAGHYARTLRAWQRCFSERVEQVRALGYSEEFIRMWRFYLSYCEGGFLERVIGLSHLVFARARSRFELPVV